MRVRIVRLAVWLAALTIVVFGVPLAIAAAQYLTSDQYRSLEGVAEAVALEVTGDLKAPLTSAASWPAGVQVGVYDERGQKVSGAGPGTAPGVITAALRGTSQNSVDAGRLAATAAVSDGDAVVGAVLATVATSTVYVKIGVVWLAMLALAGAALGIAWLLARRQAANLVRPLQMLSTVAERLGGGDFTVRADPAGIAEIDSVTDSVNRTATRLGALMERERAFSADASHQLRTPLTGLRLQLEAALDQPGADLRAAITDALVGADRLEATIDQLLALARDVPAVAEAVDLDAVVDSIRRRWYPDLAARGRPLQATGTGLPRAHVQLAVLTQVVDVLIDNAGRHGAGPVTVAVRFLDDAVAVGVSDEGPPLRLDPAALFRRRSVPSDGHGIGLSLARRLAESQGGRLHLTATSPPTFTLLLPTATPNRAAGTH